MHTRQYTGYRISRLVVAAIATISVVVPAVARAADFSPTADYQMCTADSEADCVPNYYTASAVQFRVQLSQDKGEEELKHISLKVPAGFRYPKDEQLTDGERLGNADIVIDFGPGCAGGVGTHPFEINGYFEERDRTDDEVDDGVRVVFRLNLDPIPPIDLKVYGTPRLGYHIETDISETRATCPPFNFDAVFFANSEDSGIPLLRTPKTPGRYVMRAIFTSTQDSVVKLRYPFDIS